MQGSITLRLPADTKLPVPVSKWERLYPSQCIEATYTKAELAWSLACIGNPAGEKWLSANLPQEGGMGF